MSSILESSAVRGLVVAALIAVGATASGDPTAPRATLYASSLQRTPESTIEQFKLLFPTDARTIDWESVPDQFATPNAFPTDFFNRDQQVGLVVTTTGLGEFRVSARTDNPSGTPLRFGDILPAYADNFVPWSGDRIFAPLSGNVFDFDFFVPGTPHRALVRGFGAVFTDVELDRSVTMEFFHGGSSLGVFDVPVMGFGRHAFLGVWFGDAVVTRVRITMQGRLGDTEKLTGTDRRDLVALDDLVFTELTPAADLSATLDARREGGDIVYTARVANGSAADGRSVHMEETLPSDVTVVSLPPGAVKIGNVVSWDVGSVPVALTRSFEIRVTPNAVGLHRSTLVIRADNDSDLLDNFAAMPGVPFACAPDLSFDAIGCRLTEMRDILTALDAPRALRRKLASPFSRARALTARARSLDAGAHRRGADSRLAAAAHVLAPFRFVLGSKSALRFLPKDVRELLEDRAFESIFALRGLEDR